MKNKIELGVIGFLTGLSLWLFFNPTIQEVEKIKDFEKSLISYMNSEYKDLMDSVSETGDYNDDIAASFKEGLDKFISTQTW